MLLRSVIALVAVACCLFAMQAAARFGFARLLGKYAVAASSIPAADQAVSLAPADAEVHRARARVLNRLQRPQEARKSFEIATSLRYRDDLLWLELGSTREELGDTAAALAAFDQAVRWAPYYAHPLWQRGNLKLRMGLYADGLAELRGAAAIKNSLVPSLIDLAWGLSRGDVKTVEQLINNDRDRLAFAQFLARKGMGDESVRQARLLVSPLSTQNRQELVQQLVAAKSFRRAFELWRTDRSVTPPIILDGGFEELSRSRGPFEDRGFGWYIFGKAEPAIGAQESEKLSGAKSLQVSFHYGEWKAPGETIWQRIVVEPERRYRISFGVKTKEVVTGGPPAIAVKDAGTDQRLGQSDAFPTPSSNWQTMSFEFSTAATTQAIVLEFTRVENECTPCPIFGTFWVDDLVIEDVTPIITKR